jgi:hypothetical protein
MHFSLGLLDLLLHQGLQLLLGLLGLLLCKCSLPEVPGGRRPSRSVPSCQPAEGSASQQRVLQRVLLAETWGEVGMAAQDVLPGLVTAAIQSSPVDLG